MLSSDIVAPITLTRADEEGLSILSGEHVVRLDVTSACGPRLFADAVPPAVVAEILEHLSLGRLVDYDKAQVRRDWRNQLAGSIEGGSPTMTVRVLY